MTWFPGGCYPAYGAGFTKMELLGRYAISFDHTMESVNIIQDTNIRQEPYVFVLGTASLQFFQTSVSFTPSSVVAHVSSIFKYPLYA